MRLTFNRESSIGTPGRSDDEEGEGSRRQERFHDLFKNNNKILEEEKPQPAKIVPERQRPPNNG